MKKVVAAVVIVLTIVTITNYSKSKLEENNISKSKLSKTDSITQKEKKKDSSQSNLFSDNVVTQDEEIETSDEVVQYIEDVVEEAENLKQSDDGDKLKNTFITLTDFIFYDGKIKGYTFSELKDNEKQKVLSLWEKLDKTIENKHPGYKDEIESTSTKTYSNIKDKVVELKEEIISKYKDTVGEENYNYTVEDYNDGTQNLKDNVSPYIDKGKEISQNVRSKIKQWYENYRSN